MEKTKALSVQGITVSLIISLAVSMGLYLVRIQPIISRSMPVFVGGELSVSKLQAKPLTQTKVEVGSASVAETPIHPTTVPSLPIVPPMIIFQVIPEYPAQLLEQGLIGTTVLSVSVGLAGNSERVEIKTSSGVVEFDNAAVKAAQSWRFTPASQGGIAIASCFEVPVRFEVQ